MHMQRATWLMYSILLYLLTLGTQNQRQYTPGELEGASYAETSCHPADKCSQHLVAPRRYQYLSMSAPLTALYHRACDCAGLLLLPLLA